MEPSSTISNICPACGASNPETAKFCNECGKLVAGGTDWHKLVLIGGGIILIIIVVSIIIAVNNRSQPDDTTQSLTAQQRLEKYTDNFLSKEVNATTTGQARVRNFPTVNGSTVNAELGPNEPLAGRWVTGVNPSSRWLKLNNGGYVWDGNLYEDSGEVDNLSACEGEQPPTSVEDAEKWQADCIERSRQIAPISKGLSEADMKRMLTNTFACMGGPPKVNYINILRRGESSNREIPIEFEFSYVCPNTGGTSILDSGEKFGRKKISFQKDEFGDWSIRY